MIKSFDKSTIFHEAIYFNSGKSYLSNDTIELYGLRDNNIGASLEIKTLNGKKVLEEPLNFKTSYPEVIDPQKGYPESKIKDLTLTNFSPGIYIINDQYYFVVRGKEKTSVTFIVPSLSTICIDSTGGYSLLNENKKKTCASVSILKPIKIDNYSLQLNNLLQILPDNMTINFCTDLDLQYKGNIPESEVYVLYGKTQFSTPSMLSNLNQKILEGKSLILLTAYTFNNKVFYNNRNKRINVCQDSEKENFIIPYSEKDTLSNNDVFCANYTFGGHPKSLSFPHKVNTLPPYLDNNITNLPLFSDLWIGAKDSSLVNFWYQTSTKYHELNTIGGIFTYQPTMTSGTIFHLGTSSWLEKSNLNMEQNREMLLQIIKEAARKNN